MRSILCSIASLWLIIGSLTADNLKRTTLSHPADPTKEIEVISMEPEGIPDFPLIVLLQGASMKNGANDFGLEKFQYWIDKGIGVAAISLPGYGKSLGLKDQCGPFTMQALNAAIDCIKQEMPITSMGVIGFGVGGLAATLLSTQRCDLSCVVSANAAYDLNSLHNENDLIRKQLVKNNVAIEFSPEEIRIRSPMEHVSSIGCPLFLLHRELNPLVTASEVVCFKESVNSSGGDCTTVFLSGGDADQKISYKEFVEIAGEWIEQHLTR